jgi:NAD(P)-dependent dehydrogenase (short-subunit alcohol dehydrogenase family)
VSRHSLSDKVVLITGACRGLAAATATALTQRGVRAVIADVDLSTAQSFGGIAAVSLNQAAWLSRDVMK